MIKLDNIGILHGTNVSLIMFPPAELSHIKTQWELERKNTQLEI